MRAGVLDGAAAALVVRPGLVVGPGDPTGRFSYWPHRMAAGGEVLAPGSPEDEVQVLDVRDLAGWLVDSAERRRTGVLDAVGPTQPISDLLGEVAGACAPVGTRMTWVPQEVLTGHGVAPWSGPDAVPLWLPRPDYDGMLAHDPAPARTAGLTCRPLAETARDTLAWLRSTADPPLTGWSRERERSVLAAWHAAPGPPTYRR